MIKIVAKDLSLFEKIHLITLRILKKILEICQERTAMNGKRYLTITHLACYLKTKEKNSLRAT